MGLHADTIAGELHPGNSCAVQAGIRVIDRVERIEKKLALPAGTILDKPGCYRALRLIGGNTSRERDGDIQPCNDGDKAVTTKHPFSPTALVLKILTLMACAGTAWFIFLGVFDAWPPTKINAVWVSEWYPQDELAVIGVNATPSRYCSGWRYGALRDHLSLALDPLPIPPKDWKGPVTRDGQTSHNYFFPVTVPKYFWNEGDWVYRPTWHFQCNSLQGHGLPEIILDAGPGAKGDAKWTKDMINQPQPVKTAPQLEAAK